MYRIELAPGEETVFRTIEELAVAVRNGLVTPRCRIYHNATQKWLPIEFHPHYKQALSLPAARIAEAVAPRTSGHPPRLETLSFAVPPAAKSTPAPEPVAEPAAETRKVDNAIQSPAQPRPQAEPSAQAGSLAKRPGGVQRVAPQGAEHAAKKHSAAGPTGAKRSGAEADPLEARYSGMEHPVAMHSVTTHAVEKSAVEKSAVEKPALEKPAVETHGVETPAVEKHAVQKHAVQKHSVAKQAVDKRSATWRAATQHSSVEHSATDYSVPEHSAPEHSAPTHQATDHPAATHVATTHSPVMHRAADEAAAQAAAEHPFVEHRSTTESPTVHPVARSSYPAHPAAEPTHASRVAAEHRFASHTDMATAAPSQAEPAGTSISKSSYRPDSYLPPSVRAMPDAPYVATAPEPAAAPPVHTEPVNAWPVMPAVPETPELPTISYPEFTPAEEPVAERASSSRGHRPLQVAVALLVLAAGGYLARSFYSPVRDSNVDNSSTPAAAVADRPALPADAPPAAPSAVTTKPSPNRPAVVAPIAPASSGFAAALEPRAIASGPAPILPARAAAADQPQTPTADSSGATGPIAPAPTEMQIDVPVLPGGDSLVAQPRSKSDSAMKRILRAVTGGKDAR